MVGRGREEERKEGLGGGKYDRDEVGGREEVALQNEHHCRCYQHVYIQHTVMTHNAQCCVWCVWYYGAMNVPGVSAGHTMPQ